MWHILNYKLLMLSTILLANAYQKERAIREHRRQVASLNHKRPPPESSESSGSSSESDENSHYERSADLTYRHPGSAPPARRTPHNRYVESRENRPRPLNEPNKRLHYDAISGDDSLETAKDALNKAGNSGDRRYLDNYDERQLQATYTDNAAGKAYKTTNGEAQNVQHSYNRETDRARQFERPVPYEARDLRHESYGTGDDRRYNDYNGSGGKNTRPIEYSHNPREYPNDQTKVFSTSHSSGSRSYSSGSTTIPSNNNERYYDHAQPNQDTFKSSNYRPNVPGYSPVHDKIPSDPHYNGPKHQEHSNSDYREPTLLDQLPYNVNYQDVPLQEQAHDKPLLKHSDQSQQSPHVNLGYRDTRHTKDVHSNFDHRYPSVPQKQQTDYNSQESISPVGSGVNSNLQHSAVPEQYHIGDRGALQHLHQNLDAQKEELTHVQNLDKKEQRDNHQMPLPQHQNERNPMKVVATKKDMQPAPSEADNSKFNEEHDGFLDMGAYTDKQGSFGWYADFPVGKEHDKVTYSFS